MIDRYIDREITYINDVSYSRVVAILAAHIACFHQLPRMVADRNVTYTTSLYVHWFLQGKKRHCLFACSCDLARVYMRFSPLSRSRVHAIFFSRVHATPRPSFVVEFCCHAQRELPIAYAH